MSEIPLSHAGFPPSEPPGAQREPGPARDAAATEGQLWVGGPQGAAAYHTRADGFALFQGPASSQGEGWLSVSRGKARTPRRGLCRAHMRSLASTRGPQRDLSLWEGPGHERQAPTLRLSAELAITHSSPAVSSLVSRRSVHLLPPPSGPPTPKSGGLSCHKGKAARGLCLGAAAVAETASKTGEKGEGLGTTQAASSGPSHPRLLLTQWGGTFCLGNSTAGSQA